MQTQTNRPDTPEPAAVASGTLDTSPLHLRAPPQTLRRFGISAVVPAPADRSAAAAAVGETATAQRAAVERAVEERSAVAAAPAGLSQPRKKCRTASPPQFAGGHLGKLDFRFPRCSLVIIGSRCGRHHAHQNPKEIDAHVNDARDDAAPKPYERHPTPAGRRTAVLDRIKLKPADDRRRYTRDRPAAKERQDSQDQRSDRLLSIFSARILPSIACRCPVLGSRLLPYKRRRLLPRRGTERSRAIEAKGRFRGVRLIAFWARLCHIGKKPEEVVLR